MKRTVIIGWPDGENPEVCEEEGQGAVRFIEKSYADTLESKIREASECFDIAYFEGLPEAMNAARSGDASKLVDILDRRLLYALAPLKEAMELFDEKAQQR